MSRTASFSPYFLNQVFSTKTIRDVTSGIQPEWIEDLPLLADSVNREGNIGDLLNLLISDMKSNRRIELVYKNQLILDELLRKHSLSSSSVVQELRVAGSIADLVITNGKSVVYEIKTELDSPARLMKQLIDYWSCFTHVVVVAHHTQQQKYTKLLSETNAGLHILESNGRIVEIAPASAELTYLSNRSMIRVLRKQEIFDLVKRLTGISLNCPNGVFHSSAQASLSGISEELVNFELANQLRLRNLKTPKHYRLRKYQPILANCVQLDLSAEEFRALSSWLESPLMIGNND